MAIRVLLHCTINEGVDPAVFERTFEQISHTIFASNPGIIKDELIRSADDPKAYILLRDWASKEALEKWRHSAVHVEQMRPLSELWKRGKAYIYETVFINDPAMR